MGARTDETPGATGALTGEVTELLQELIRATCVNDGTEGSGHEVRAVDILRPYLEGTGLDLETYEPRPGRQSLIARIEGSDPDAPSLMLMGHTDVVPADAERWERDPFGGELVDGIVWGRGAVDMLNLTASMAVAFRHLADGGFTPAGDLVYLAVADEEAGGTWGAEWLVDNEPDAVRVDNVITEYGGTRLDLAGTGAPRLPVAVAEKGAFWATLRFRGVPGHGSMPLRTDNALTSAAEAVRRVLAHRPSARMHDIWRGFVEGLELDEELAGALLDPDALDAFCEDADDLGLARVAHACTRTTIAPTVMAAGVKQNVIPDRAELALDIRALPGEDESSIRRMIVDALGDLTDRVEIDFLKADAATTSPTDTALWDVLQRHAGRLVPGSRNIPVMLPAATDSRFLRRLGATCYGYGLYSDRIPFGEFTRMFHGENERVDQTSLQLSTRLWIAVAQDLLGG